MATNYETDFFYWTQEQALLLRDKMPNIDNKNLADEIASLGLGLRRELLQPDRCAAEAPHQVGASTTVSLTFLAVKHPNAAARDEWILKDSPSLQEYAATEAMERAYPDAIEKVVEEIQLLSPKAIEEGARYTFSRAMTMELGL